MHYRCSLSSTKEKNHFSHPVGYSIAITTQNLHGIFFFSNSRMNTLLIMFNLLVRNTWSFIATFSS